MGQSARGVRRSFGNPGIRRGGGAVSTICASDTGMRRRDAGEPIRMASARAHRRILAVLVDSRPCAGVPVAEYPLGEYGRLCGDAPGRRRISAPGIPVGRRHGFAVGLRGTALGASRSLLRGGSSAGNRGRLCTVVARPVGNAATGFLGHRTGPGPVTKSHPLDSGGRNRRWQQRREPPSFRAGAFLFRHSRATASGSRRRARCPGS